MNLIETLVAKATEEACELGKALSKLNVMGVKAVDAENGSPLTADVIKQFNELLGCVELLRDRGVPMAGIGDPVAVGEAKTMIVQTMEEAMKAGTLVLSEDDQNPRPEGVNEPDTGLPAGDAAEGDGENADANAEGDGGEATEGDGTSPSEADGSADTSGDEGSGGDSSEEEEESGEEEPDVEESEEEEEEPGSNDV